MWLCSLVAPDKEKEREKPVKWAYAAALWFGLRCRGFCSFQPAVIPVSRNLYR
jgi:hypothetical protein